MSRVKSIHGAEIIHLTRLFFDPVAEIDVGFTLTVPLLNPIISNFDDGNELHQAILRLIFYLEQTLIDEGSMPADVKFVIAKRRQ